MKVSSFRGGIHPEGNKELTSGKPVEVMPVPEVLYLPLSMHWNKPCDPIVKAGDRVLMGQTIADSENPIPVPIHSPVSGKVLRIEDHEYVTGGKKTVIVIENDYADTPDPSVFPILNWMDMSSDELISIIRSKGIVGMGGAAFPTHYKLASVRGSVDTLIVNAAECEPYLTCDHRLLLEQYAPLIYGIIILKQILNLDSAYIAFEENKINCEARILSYMKEKNVEGIETVILPNKYPQGYEKQLIQVIKKREIPPGKLPGDVGCVILNAQTVAAIGIGFATGLPLIKRIVTVSGDAVAVPKNLEVRLGSTIESVINAAGGYSSDPESIIVGGPMMGFPQYSTDAVVIKSTNGVLVFGQKDKIIHQDPACIRCGKCVEVCPINLQPIYLNMYASSRDYAACESNHLRECMECGSCAYICPAKIPLVETFRIAKTKLPPPSVSVEKNTIKGGKRFGKKK